VNNRKNECIHSTIHQSHQCTNPTNVPPAEPNTIFILHPAFQKLFVVGDLDAWNAANPGVGAVEVVRMPLPRLISVKEPFAFLFLVLHHSSYYPQWMPHSILLFSFWLVSILQ
jgi:hypothetical protein